MFAPKPLKLPLLIGRNPLIEALSQGTPIEKLFILRTATGEDISTIKRQAHLQNIPISLVPIEKLNRFSAAAHQGVVAIVGVLNYVDIQSAIDFVNDKGNTPLFLLLDGLTDVRNIGAIARTAWCMGAQALLFPSSHSATLHEEAVKTSAGALQKLLLCRTPSIQQAIDVLKLNGIQILGTEMRASQPIHTCDFTLPTCIVMGAEDKGISKEVLKRADTLIHIPMVQNFDSLNVSVAAGMILYEAMSQRNK